MTAPLNIFASDAADEDDVADLLVAQGLVTHVAELGPGPVSTADVARFRQDAARKAATVITLAERRFGIALPPSVRLPLSDVPHHLQPADPARLAVPDGADALLQRLEPALLGIEARLQAVEALAAPASLARAAGQAVADGLEGALATLEGLALTLEDRTATKEAAEPDGRNPGEALAELERRLGRIQETLDRLDETARASDAPSPEQVPDQAALLDRVEQALARTADTEALSGVLARLSGQVAEASDAQIARYDALSERIAALESGRLGGTEDIGRRLDAIDAMLRADAEPKEAEDEDDALEEVVREALADALSETVSPLLSGVEDSLAERMAAVERGLSGLVERLETGMGAEAERAARVPDATAEAMVAPLAAVESRLLARLQAVEQALADLDRPDPGQGAESVADRVLSVLSPVLTATEERLAGRVASVESALADIADIAAEPDDEGDARDTVASIVDGIAPVLADLEDRVSARIAALDRAAEAGGMPSPSLSQPDGPDPATLLRSIRNFWLAIEEALSRQGRILDRMERQAGPDPEAVLRGLDSRIEERLAEVDALLDRIVAGREAGEARPDMAVRHGLAELLAAWQRREAEGHAK